MPICFVLMMARGGREKASQRPNPNGITKIAFRGAGKPNNESVIRYPVK